MVGGKVAAKNVRAMGGMGAKGHMMPAVHEEMQRPPAPAKAKGPPAKGKAKST